MYVETIIRADIRVGSVFDRSNVIGFIGLKTTLHVKWFFPHGLNDINLYRL